MGAFAGDGSYYYSTHGKSSHYRTTYHLSLIKDIPYAKYLFKLLKRLNLNPFIFKDSGNRINVVVNSIDYIRFIKKYLVWRDIKTYSVRLKNHINNYSDDFLYGFARGLMATDGFVESHSVACAYTSKDLIVNNLGKIFNKLGIEYNSRVLIRKGKQDLYRIRTYKRSLKIYEEKINFSNGYKKDSLLKIIN